MTDLKSLLLDESPAALDVVVDLRDKQRLAFIKELDVVDEPRERSMQVIVQLAMKLLNVPVSLITMVLEDRQFFVASEGLDEKWTVRRQTPLSHSFCRHVVEGNDALIVSDASKHSLVAQNLAIPELGVSAYLGVPLQFSSDAPVGALCVIDSQPRQWTQEDLDTLQKTQRVDVLRINRSETAYREQKQLEMQLQQAQKAEAIGQCVVGISHDINNILGAVHTTAEVLETKLAKHDIGIAAEEVAQIKETVSSAKKLMKRLLRWGTPGQRMKPIPLTQITRDALPVLRACVSSVIDINYHAFDADDQTCIFADEGELSQLLLNLCTNAEHAMQEIGGSINIAVKRSPSASPAQVELTVTDTGTGIDPKIIDRIQDPYFTTKAPTEGHGLGLWTVFGIATGHDADINIDSTVGIGTCVSVKFPVVESGKPTETEDTKTPSIEKPSDRVRTILLVDDNEVILQGMDWLLTEHGYQVVSCSDSVTAFQRFLRAPKRFDIVISDRRMPRMSGEELLTAIKAIRSEVATILCSGVAPPPGEQWSIGADAFCLKPWTIEELTVVISDVCDA